MTEKEQSSKKMEKDKTGKSTTKANYQISDQEFAEGQKGKYEIAFRRWIVREIQAGRMTVGEVIQRFGFEKKKGVDVIRYWTKRYGSEINHTLPVMNEKEKARLQALEQQNKELLKELEHAQMKNIALETLIDVAEEDLKINIRKKRGAKQ